ncbi:hypothetical protein ABIA35_000014 [Catenulispora sp. MAP12-49]|uniref:hypothetical protein n=1 Tax=unclassified Catenulispora TaxID=414885 RepID=UPI003513E888
MDDVWLAAEGSKLIRANQVTEIHVSAGDVTVRLGSPEMTYRIITGTFDDNGGTAVADMVTAIATAAATGRACIIRAEIGPADLDDANPQARASSTLRWVPVYPGV